MALLLTVLVVFVVLLLSEVWWRTRRGHGELSRKSVHITVGSFVAFWPYFLSINDIKLLSVAFLVAVAVSKYLHIFRAIHSVQRPTWGEFWFALVVGLLAFTAGHHPHIYTAALLEMSLADGLAAVIGTRYGNRHRYVVFGAPKSLIGTLTFFVTSCVILAGYAIVSTGLSPVLLLVPIAFVATVLENLGTLGSDNLLVPLFTAAALLFFN
jgi:phytol kinase